MRRPNSGLAKQARDFLRWFYLPSLALILLPALMVARSLTFHNYASYALFAQSESYLAEFWIGVVLAAFLAFWPEARRKIVAHFEKLSSAPRRWHFLWLGIAYLGAVAWMGFPRFCQIRTFQMPPDTANSINSAYGFIHQGVMEFTPFGTKAFAIQPLLLMAVYSPILLIWNSPYALYLLQHLFLCAAPFAAYGLVFELTESSLAGFAALLLALLNPFFLKLINANLSEAAMCVFVLWALYMLKLGRRGAATALIVVALCCSWEVPFVFFGLGLYLTWIWRDRRPRAWSTGLLICAASASLWLIELAVVKHYQRLEVGAFGARRFNYWLMFAHLVPPGIPGERIPLEIFSHPFRTVVACLHPYVFYPFLFLLASTGFLSLLAPIQMIPLLFTSLPHVLSVTVPHSAVLFSTFSQHNGSPAFGLLLFATVYGLSRCYAWLAARHAQAWLLAAALLIPHFTINFSGDTGALLPDWRPTWFYALPRLMSQIPPKSRVWADDYAATALANRRWIKAVSYVPAWFFGDDDHVFKPDYVLLDSPWLDKADVRFREQILTYLSRNGYVLVAADTGLILWKSPDPSPAPEETPEWIRLPEPDAAAAAAFANAAKDFVLRQDHSREAEEKLLRLQDDAAIHPKSLSAEKHLELGMLLAGKGRTDEAVEQYVRALQEKPDFARAHFALGVARAGQGKADEALQQFDLALQEDPDFAEARFNMGLTLSAQGKLDDAVREFTRAIQKKPDYAEAHFGLGVALVGQGRTNEAIRQYGLAIKANPQLIEAHYNLGNLYARQGRSSEAIEQYRQTLSLNPTFAHASDNLEFLLDKLKRAH
ncbi:MAG: tetratricopeptide repeat protein [Elusimicrobiota bacterium]